jgi:hypothetical protein
VPLLKLLVIVKEVSSKAEPFLVFSLFCRWSVYIWLFRFILSVCNSNHGRAVAQWLSHYAINRQVAGSIPDGVIGILQ